MTTFLLMIFQSKNCQHYQFFTSFENSRNSFPDFSATVTVCFFPLLLCQPELPISATRFYSQPKHSSSFHHNPQKRSIIQLIFTHKPNTLPHSSSHNQKVKKRKRESENKNSESDNEKSESRIGKSSNKNEHSKSEEKNSATGFYSNSNTLLPHTTQFFF